MKDLKTMQAEVYEVNVAKGWRGDGASEPTFLEAMALLHTEVSEAVEAWRRWGLADATQIPTPATPRPRTINDAAEDLVFASRGLVQRQPQASPPPLPKPEGVGSELADVLIRLLDDADLFGVDLDAEYERKMAYNRTRAFHHGGKRL